MKFPVKYLEENLVFASDGNVYAYYECGPYNYSFLGEDKAEEIYHNLEQMILSARSDRMHMLCIAIEESIHETIERSKREIKGELREIACRYMDGVEEHLKRCHGENELDYRHYIGFRLSLENSELSKGSVLDSLRRGIGDSVKDVNKEVFGDYVKVDNDEIEKYLRLEKLLRHNLMKKIPMRRVEPRDMAYIIRHLNGQKGVSYDNYDYRPETIVDDDVTCVKSYDVIRLSDCLIKHKPRYLHLLTEEGEQYVAYLALSDITGELAFPGGSELLYYQQENFDFPVDVSLKVERLENRAALGVVRNKKLELKDLDESALEADAESSDNVLEARADVSELEARLEKEKGDMYKVSYLLRVSGRTEEELAKRIAQVKDFYNMYHILLQRPLGDQMGLHHEFYPTTPRHMDDYVQYVNSDFLSSIGFGAGHRLGEREGIYLGYNVLTGRSVYVKPWLAAQGVAGSVTNALAKAFIGSLGGGKSVTMNLLAFWSVLFGGRALIIDPKGERGNWREDLEFLGEHLNIINVTPEESKRGLLDPFSIMESAEEARELAADVLTYLTGISAKDSERFPVLYEHIEKVSRYPEDRPKGMLCIVEELRDTDTDISRSIANHIQSFTNLSIAGLMFGDGTLKQSLKIDSLFNVLLMQDLTLPEGGVDPKDYTLKETLSVSIMLLIATFSLRFVDQTRIIYKDVVLDEAWSWLQAASGKALGERLVRTGRSRNAAIEFGTQNCEDLLSEKMKNNIGLKFAFRSRDREEIRKVLSFMGLEHTEDNIVQFRMLNNGECMLQDLYGQCGIIHVDCVFAHLLHAFDTRPPEEDGKKGVA